MASVLSANLRRPSSTAGRPKSSQKISISRAQLLIGNRLDKSLGSDCRLAVEFANLRGGRARGSQRFAFRGHLAHQADRLRLRCVEAAARQHQITHHGIAKVPLQSRYPAKARNQPQPQFRKDKIAPFCRR